ncbi:MAG TPA: tetratricopeptide repeat protein, partial [Candidatus Eisenbacteria bacterium]|nr:tetratricopeptide repeat protein [Candidatus Eisenbacteria bacterium]
MHSSSARILASLLLASAVCAAVPASPDSMPPYEAVVRFAQARLLESQGDLPGALDAFSHVLAIDPRSGDAARHVSDLAARLGQTGRALEAARQAIAIDPTDARARWLEGSALLELGRNEEALAALEQAARADSDNAEYQRTLARAAEQLDRVPVVARAWRAASDLDPDDGETWFQLAAAEARLGHFGAADSALAEARERVPDRPGMLFLEGWIRESTGHPKQAIALYQKHLAVNADDQLTRQRLVNLLAGESRYPEAWAEAKKVASARAQDPQALEAEAELAFRAGHAPEGHAALAKLQALAGGEVAGAARAAAVLG